MKHLIKTMAFTLLGLVLSVNLAWAADTYVKVTSTTDLKIGDEYAIVTGSTYALTTEMNGSNGLKFAAATVNKDQSITLPSKGASFKLGGTEGAYTLSDDNGYFSANGTGNKSRYLSTKSTIGESEFAISFNATSGSLTLTTQQSTARTLKANSTTDARFYSTNSGNVVYLYKKKVDTPAYTITAQSNNTTFGTVSLSGSVITASPNVGYRYANPAYTVSPDGSATVKQEGNEFTVTPTKNCTIQINFEVIPKHKVYWSQNGDVSKYDEVAEGADITFPETAEGCDGKTFMGWVGETDKNYQSDKTAPTYITSATMGKQDITYYAVFADKKGDGGSVTITNDDIKNSSLTGSYAEKTITVGTYTFTVQACKMSDKLQIRDNSTLSFIQIPELPGAITNISSSACSNSSSPEGNYTGILHFKSAKTRGNANTNDIDRIDCSSGVTSINWDVNNTGKAKSGYLLTSGGLRLYDLTISYGDVEISNYTTTCCTKHEVKKGTMAIGGFTATPAQACAEAEISLAPDEVTGYNFKNFTFATEGGVSIDPDDLPFVDNEFLMPDYNIVVTANYEAISYNISYNLDGGSWNGAAGVASYTYGTGIETLPTNVEKANNTFLGWYVSNPAEIVKSIGATETGDKFFIASWLPNGARDVAYSGDDQLNYISNPLNVDKDDASLTVTYSVNKGYTISAVAVTVNDAALTESEVVFNDEQLTITPTASFTGNVSIAFTVVNKMFTVTWMANKTQFKQEQIQEGRKVTLPTTNPSDVDGDDGTYKFQGWYTEEQYSNETTAPAYIEDNAIEPTGDVTYYAVYAMKESQTSSTTFVKGALSDLTTGQKVVIVEYTDKMALTSTATDDTYNLKNKSVSPSNNKITSVTDDIKWTVTKNSNTYQFKQGDKYLYGYSDGQNHYNLKFGSTSDSWTIASGGTGYTLESGLYSGYKLEYFSSKFTIYKKDALDKAFYMDFYIPQVTETIKNYRTRVAIIDYIAVHEAPLSPERTNLVAGETFDATGLTIDVHYQGEDNPTNVTEGFTFAPTGALTTENNKITFTYQGKTADVDINVNNTVSKIEVTTDPTKMEYTEGQQFDPAGMVVTATYGNGAERVVTGYTYTPTGDLALDDVITISFGGQTTELKDIKINAATKTTVKWYVNGVELTEGEQSTAVIPGKKVTALPTEPEACQGNQFVGWTAVDANYYNATTAPTDLFKTWAEAPTIGETETSFYAVFAQLTATPVAESTVYTSNIDNDVLTDKVKIGGSEENKVAAIKLGTSGTPASSLSFSVPAGTTTITLHAVAWKDKSNVTITMSTEKAGVVITPSDAQAVSANDGASNNSPFPITPADGDFYTFTLSGVTEETEVKISNATERVVLWGINTATTITSDYSTTCLPALTAPTITTPEGEYCGSVDVVITQPVGNPEDAKIMYSTDNETWDEYTAAVNITTSGTVYAKVVKEPKQTEVVSAAYTVHPAYTLADAATAATATSQIACLTFTDLLVQARSLSEAFLKASDGQIVLLSKSSHGLSVGDKLSATDAHLNFIKSHDLLQLTSMEGVEKPSTGNATTPEEKAITALAAADYGKLVKIMNVTYDATDKKFIDASSNEIAIDAKFFVSGSLPSSWPDGGKFNATGIVLTDGDNVVIAPRNTDDLESLATPLLPPTDFVVASVNSYQASYTWTAVENNAGYTLYIYDGDNQVYKSNTIGSAKTSYAPTTELEAGHTYTAKLVALGDKAEHSDSPAAEVTFTTNPNAKLNWYVGGTLYQTTDARQEKVVTPETDPTSPCATNYENFVTWYTEEIVSETGQITALEASKKVKAGDAAASATTEQVYNFYAVFGKIKTAGTDKYVAVTSEPTKWEGEYLIVHNDSVFNGGLTSLDVANNGFVLTREEDGSYLASNANDYRFTISKSKKEGDYYIQSASGYYIANTTNENKLSSDNKNGLDNIISWVNGKVEIKSDANENVYTFLTFNTTSNQLRFRYMKNDAGNIVLYKRTKTNPQYSGYITTCPVTYTITIANNTKGLVEAATKTEILAGAKVQLTATAYDGYTKTGGNWIVKNTATQEVVEDPVGSTNYLTMPDYDVTVDYDFQEIKDNFVDNLHGNTTIEKGGANYELPTLSDFSETTGAPSDAFKKFIGWSATSYDSGEPATEQPTILEGSQTATGTTYFAVWYNQSGKYITEYCQTSAPANLHLVAEYHKATSVRIDWNNVDGADKYHIIVMDDEAEIEIIADADVTESLYDLSGLTPGATYYYSVKAHKDCWSDETLDEFTTKENIQSYAVTINAEGGTYQIDPELVDGKIQEGATVTITDIAPTDAAHYFFKELTVPEATDLTEITGGYKFTMPGKAVTINIVFAEYPTVTWKMEGAADVVTTAVLDDDKFVIGVDNMQSAPADWKYKTYFPEFAGWVTSDKCDEEGNVTTAEFISATTEVPADGLTVYGAVAKSSAPDCSTATKITSNENLDMSALYVIGAEYDKATLYYTGIDGTWGKTTLEEPKTPITFTISGTKDAIAILGSDENYIKGCTSKSFAVSSDKQEVMIAEGGNIIFGTPTWYLQYNNNNNSGGLRWYSSTSNPLAYLYKVALAYEKLTINPQPDYARTDLVVGNYGTVCVPYAVNVDDRSGATFWNIETSNAPGYASPTSVTIVQEEGELKAGKPYIFFATDTKMELFYSGDIYDGSTFGADYPHYNGLYGNLTAEIYTINEMGYTPGYFFVLQQKLYECGTNCTVRPNRGWVQADQIGSEPVEAPVSAPRRTIGRPNGTPTGIDNLNGEGWIELNGAHKYLHNNHIIIVNEGRIFNAQGALVK